MNTTGMLGLSEKVVFLTGAGRGIGKALAFAFAQEGAHLVILSKSDHISTTAKDLMREYPNNCIELKGDVSQFDFVQDSVNLVMERWGKIDILVNAAAILGPTGRMHNNEVEAWIRTIEVNLLGVFNTMRAVIPVMVSQGAGKIINFAGGGAAYAYPRFTAYATSKVAVVRLTETVAEEYAKEGIQANVIAPGAVETDMLQKVRAARGEVRTVVDIQLPVQLVLFLASSSSDHVNGRFIHSKDDYRSFDESLKQDQYKLRRLV